MGKGIRRSSSPASPAARHRMGVTGKFPGHPRAHDLVKIPGNKGNYPDSTGCGHLTDLPGKGAADQTFNLQFNQAQNLSGWMGIGQKLLGPAESHPLSLLDNQDLPGGIEYRGDALSPVWKCRFHQILPPL
ncbi:MAG: hypothetical protein WBN83_18365 [Desulfoprunum sp.]|uniref:hypothetical protein n=1 Tax=Desulfoprunum sp. TaxID=2020866 RepID=UPI003C74A746